MILEYFIIVCGVDIYIVCISLNLLNKLWKYRITHKGRAYVMYKKDEGE